MINKKLEGIIKKIEKRGKRSNRKSNEVFTYLNNQLSEKNLEGEVVSVITHDMNNKRINCYGNKIPDGLLFGALNLSIGARGTRVTGTISYPNIERLSSYQQGYLVPLESFGLKNSEGKNEYVALINIAYDLDSMVSDVIRFP